MLLRGVTVLVAMLLARGALAACGDRAEDAAAVAAARAQVEALCDCATTASHRAWAKCAGGVIAAEVASRRLRADCKGVVRRCVVKATCGRPDAVACCRTSPSGRLRCSVKRNAAKCRAPRGGTACVSTAPSCCEACGAGDCVPSTTSTSTTSSTSTSSTTVPTPCGETYPACNGSCPGGEHCAGDESFPPTSCACVPIGVTPCSSAAFPTCGGTCSGDGVCAPARVYTSSTGTIDYCTCMDAASDCSGSFQGGTCPGLCPEGSVCYGEPEPGGVGFCVGCLPTTLP